MNIIKYPKNRLMPVVLIFLNLIKQDYIQWAMIAALEEYYTDLKGLINPEHIDDETVEILNLLDDERIQIMLDMVGFINECSDLYANLYALDLGIIFRDKKLIGLAENLYLELCFYYDPVSVEEDLDRELILFSNNSVLLTDCLCCLIMNNYLDLDKVQDMVSYTGVLTWRWGQYLDAENYAHKMLSRINKFALECNNRIENYE